MPEEKSDHDRIVALENDVRKLDSRILSKEVLAQVVRDTMKEVLFTTGKGTKAVLITTAVIIGALAIIGGGAKFLLGLFGFQYLGKPF